MKELSSKSYIRQQKAVLEIHNRLAAERNFGYRRKNWKQKALKETSDIKEKSGNKRL